MNERFNTLKPACERAIKRALWGCQQADMEDATQIGLIEVWNKLEDQATTENTDSWFVWRAVQYARVYIQRQVWRYETRSVAIDATCEEDEESTVIPADQGMEEQVLGWTSVSERLAMLDKHVMSVAAGLLAGKSRKEISSEVGLNYKQVRQLCFAIAQVLL